MNEAIENVFVRENDGTTPVPAAVSGDFVLFLGTDDVPGGMDRGAGALLLTWIEWVEYEIVGFSHNLVHLDVSPRQRLDDIVRYMSGIPMGGTNCSLPVKMALEKKIAVDAFVLYTDNETWHGEGHVVQLLQEYRQKMGVAAKLITVNMVANTCTVADPTDGGMLDCVGFDTSVPNVISSFIRE